MSDKQINSEKVDNTNGRDTSLIGTIAESKAGYVLLNGEQVYYLLDYDAKDLINVQVKVTGKFFSEEVTEEDLGYNTKEYKQGALGTIYKIKVASIAKL